MKKRSHHYERMARVYDDEILPIWTERFGVMLLRNLDLPPKPMILEVGCNTGYVSLEVIRRIDEYGRLIAIDANSLLLDVARQKAGSLSGKRIFFRTEPSIAKLAFADEVYDLVLSNAALLSIDDPPKGMEEFARVVKPGGRVIITVPLAGTYEEFYDIYREVLTKNDQDETLERLEQHIAQIPDANEVASWMEKAGLQEIDVEIEQFSLLFKSSREFFFSPIIEFGPLTMWKAVAGKGEEMQDVFWQIKQAIDTYFNHRTFEITINPGCFRAIKPIRQEESNYQLVENGSAALPQPGASSFGIPRRVTEECSVKSIRDDFRLDEENEDDEY